MWLSRFPEWRRRRGIARARRRTLVRLVQRSVPLPPDHEAAAERLIELRGALDGDEVRTLGERLHAEGGLPLMIAVAERADTVCQLRNDASILHDVERAWDGIAKR